MSKRKCQNCLLFDETTKECGIFDGVNTNIVKTAMNCNTFIAYDFENKNPSPFYCVDDSLTIDDFKMTLLGDIEEDDEEVTPEFLFQLRGYKKPNESNYPFTPDVPQVREDAIWYVSPDQTFGCWLINNYSKKFVVAGTFEKQQIVNGVYKSLIPLHDHQSSESLRSQIAWYVNKEGSGQYVLLNHKGKIIYIYDRQKFKE